MGCWGPPVLQEEVAASASASGALDMVMYIFTLCRHGGEYDAGCQTAVAAVAAAAAHGGVDAEAAMYAALCWPDASDDNNNNESSPHTVTTRN